MIQETAAGGRFRDRVRALPTWVFVLALYAAIAAAQSFTSLSSLDLLAQMMDLQIGVPMQIFMILFSSAVTLGIYEVFDRVVYFVLQSFSRGGVLCDKRSFLKDIRMFQAARFALGIPIAILSFFYPLWLVLFSALNLALTLLCYIGLYLYMERFYLSPAGKKRVLLILMVPVLLYLLITGVAL